MTRPSERMLKSRGLFLAILSQVSPVSIECRELDKYAGCIKNAVFLPSPFSRFNVYREAKKGKETSIGRGMTHVVQTRSNFDGISNKKNYGQGRLR